MCKTLKPGRNLANSCLIWLKWDRTELLSLVSHLDDLFQFLGRLIRLNFHTQTVIEGVNVARLLCLFSHPRSLLRLSMAGWEHVWPYKCDSVSFRSSKLKLVKILFFFFWSLMSLVTAWTGSFTMAITVMKYAEKFAFLVHSRSTS